MLHKIKNDVLKSVAPLATNPWSAADESSVYANDNWMLSYIDVLTLLLTLLVLLLAHQKIQNQQTFSENHTAQADNRVSEKSVSKKQIGQLAADDDPAENNISDGIPVPEEYPVVAEIEGHSVVAKGDEYKPLLLELPVLTSEEKQLTDMHSPIAERDLLSNPPEEKEQADKPSAIAEENTQTDPVEKNESAENRIEALRLSAVLVETINNDLVEIVQEDQSVRIEFNESLLFSSGEADLKPEAGEILDKWLDLLQRQDGTIHVEGHTDNRSITTQRYPSNWELSSARAAAVTRYFIGRGIIPERLRAVGYADTRPRDHNDTAEGRKRNRRVSIVIHNRSQGIGPGIRDQQMGDRYGLRRKPIEKIRILIAGP